MAEKSKRLANIEILRITAMFFIVFTHVKTIFFQPDLVSTTEKFVNILTNVGIFSVDLFVLISGYFLITSTKMGFGHFFKILVETIFYSSVITLIFMAFGEGELKPKLYDLCASFNPLGPTRFNYWFVSRYLCMLLFAPFLSRFAQSLTKRQYKGLILVILFVAGSFCALFPLGFYLCSGWMVWWFMCVFLIGGYIRLHCPLELNKRNTWFVIFVIVSAIWLTLSQFKWFDGGYNSVLTLLSAVSLFCFFRTLQFGEASSKINFLASHAFAAYLIQEQTYFKAFIKHVGETYFSVDVTCHLYYTFCNTIIILILALCVDAIREKVFKVSGIDALTKRFSDWCLESLRKWCS
ncbi:MAG: acyltransferase [Paludibacteraceae bacterium]|nr:acyltransferase [Paludibacteraceae bacterium]